jgi:signal peptidase II
VKPIRFYLIALIIIVADQVTKWSVLKALPLGASRPAMGSFMFLTHTRNTGGAFSLFPAGNTTFIVVAFFAVGALVYAYHRYQRVNALVSGALGLALGGAVGNLVDRMRFGYVIDFFDLHAGTNHTVWPIFNVADSAITVGIVLLAWHFLFSKESTAQQKAEASSTDQASENSLQSSVIGNQSPIGELSEH